MRAGPIGIVLDRAAESATASSSLPSYTLARPATPSRNTFRVARREAKRLFDMGLRLLAAADDELGETDMACAIAKFGSSPTRARIGRCPRPCGW